MTITTTYNFVSVLLEFITNGFQNANQYGPTVVGLLNGGFAVSYGNDFGSSRTPHISIFDANGLPVSGPLGNFFLPYSGTAIGVQMIGAPDVIQLSTGGLLVTWIAAASIGNVLRSAILNPDTGQSITAEFLVQNMHQVTSFDTVQLVGGNIIYFFSTNTVDSMIMVRNSAAEHISSYIFDLGFDTYENVAVSALSNGQFAVCAQIAGEPSLVYQIRNSNGTAQGTIARIDLPVNSNIGAPAMTALPQGGFVIAYTSSTGSSAGVSLVIVTNSLVNPAPIGPIRVDTDLLAVESQANVTVLDNGFILVSYTHLNEAGDTDVMGRVFDTNGNPVNVNGTSNSFVIAAGASSASDSVLADLGQGRFIVTWTDSETDASGTSIRSELFGLVRETQGDETANLITGDDLAEVISANENNDTLNGLGGDDTLSGGDGNDLINGGDGDDEALGGIGDDTLNGGLGNDSLEGGTNTAGGDTADWSSATSAIVFALDATGGGVTDDVAGIGIDTLNGIENLIGGFGGDQLIGNASRNTLIGNAGADTLIGGLGADTMKGGIGDDVYLVDNVNDVVSEAGGSGVDTVHITLVSSYTLSTGFEYLFNDTANAMFFGFGNSLNNLLSGNSGIDNLFGGAGNDTLNGGQGNDALVGGIGNDFANGDAGDDLILLDEFAGPNRLTSSGNDIGNGGTGNDLLWGYGGNDTLNGDGDNDSIVGNDFGSNVAGVDLLNGGTGNDQLFVGSSGQATMNGDANNDSLYGGALNDTLRGGTGNDYLYGAGGADTFQFYRADLASGNSDIIFFVDATDRLKFSSDLNGSLYFQDLPNLQYDADPTHLTTGVYITAFIGGGLSSIITVYGSTVAALMPMVDYTL